MDTYKYFYNHDNHYENMAICNKWVCLFGTGLKYSGLIKCSHVKFARHFGAIPYDPELVDEFKRLRIKPGIQKKVNTEIKLRQELPPRTDKMQPDQDWTNVWPGPRTFHPAVVPLPVRQGYIRKDVPPGKFANTELMKIPNFLHLTPPAIEKHCNALKKFCTKWPESLASEEEIQKHFPVEIVSSDYCHSSPSIRDPLARIVSLRVKLSNLKLDYHAKDKLLRLVGKRYDPKTDYVTITTESCPLKKQNYEYAHYLLTAVYFESWKLEEWEKEKSNEDMETYIFLNRKSFKNVKNLFEYNNKDLPDVEKFGQAVEEWHNNGDSDIVIENYKKAVLKLLSLPALESQS